MLKYSTFILAYSLVTDYCPVAYYFGNVYFVPGIVNCNQKKSFICNNSDIGRIVYIIFSRILRVGILLTFGEKKLTHDRILSIVYPCHFLLRCLYQARRMRPGSCIMCVRGYQFCHFFYEFQNFKAW